MLHSKHFYIDDIFVPANCRKVVKNCCDAIGELRQRGIQVDALAFTGYSGSLIGSIVAYNLGLNVLIVRKEQSHSYHSFEGTIKEHGHYVIIDDFIRSGDTITHIQKFIKVWQDVQCSAILLYNQKDQEEHKKKDDKEVVREIFQRDVPIVYVQNEDMVAMKDVILL
jgi:adenine/guanine phosphoribosyltransferase-like PRPP-binding protein